MPSFNVAAKSNQKTHRERSQPAARAHLGHLEKKKDYRARTDDYQRKQNTLKALKRKALDKNPDEFYFKMVRTRLEDGVHQSEDSTPQYTDDQLALMQSQDLKYINYKRSTEVKKIEKLKGSLHLLDAPDKPKNKHVVFVDSKKKAREFDAAKHLDTHPALVGRAFNRPRTNDLQSLAANSKVDDTKLAELAMERTKSYKELTRRIQREKELNIIKQKMEMKRSLSVDKKARKKKVTEETVSAAAQYKWMPQRKR